jgi:hypothetical protein
VSRHARWCSRTGRSIAAAIVGDDGDNAASIERATGVTPTMQKTGRELRRRNFAAPSASDVRSFLPKEPHVDKTDYAALMEHMHKFSLLELNKHHKRQHNSQVRLPDDTVYHCTGHSQVCPFSTKREFVRAFMASDSGEPYRSLSEDTYVCW